MDPRFWEYQSPYGRRYGSDLSHLWSEEHKRVLWRRFWLSSLLQNAEEFHLSEQALAAVHGADLMEYAEVDYKQSLNEERITGHDLVAELRIFAKRLATFGPGGEEAALWLHAGMTSSDPEDYADEERIHQSLVFIQASLFRMVISLRRKAVDLSRTLVMGRTHLMPAEITTVGYRLITYAWWLAVELDHMSQEMERWWRLRKGVGGAVGTGYAMEFLLGHERVQLNGFPSGQTYPRQRELVTFSIMSNLASWCHKMALDFRVMQSTREFVPGQPAGRVGSSAMPGKVNPIDFEKVCSLSRRVKSLAGEAWDYSASSVLERTLDDSAARRSVVPEIFMAMSEILSTLNDRFATLTEADFASEAEIWVEWRQWFGSLAVVELLSRLDGWSREDAHKKVTEALAESTNYAECCSKLEIDPDFFDLSRFRDAVAKKIDRHSIEILSMVGRNIPIPGGVPRG